MLDFGISKAVSCDFGLNHHTVLLRVTLGLLLPTPYADKEYETNIPVRCFFPLHHALKYYWGSRLLVEGLFHVCYRQGRAGGVQLTGNWTHVEVSSSGPIFGDLRCLPIEGMAVAAFGSRHDSALFSAHLQWAETHYPHSVDARHMQVSSSHGSWVQACYGS